jgi:hypothetical protein
MSWVGDVSSEIGDLGGALVGGVVGGALAGSNRYIPAAVGGAVLGSMLGRRATGYLGDRAYEVVTGKDEEKEKALALLNMYLPLEDVVSVEARIGALETTSPEQRRGLEHRTGYTLLSPEHRQRDSDRNERAKAYQQQLMQQQQYQ